MSKVELQCPKCYQFSPASTYGLSSMPDKPYEMDRDKVDYRAYLGDTRMATFEDLQKLLRKHIAEHHAPHWHIHQSQPCSTEDKEE